MSEILNVISISSAHDWYFANYGDHVDSSQPVACFALIEYFDGSQLQKTVIALDHYAIHAGGGLIGEKLDQFDKTVLHIRDLEKS